MASSSSKPTHILYVGAGAVGCFYASRCHHPSANIHVSLICRSNYNAIAQSGVRLETRAFGNYTFHPHAVYPSISAAADDPNAPADGWDYVVVTTKALPDITDDAQQIAPLIKSDKTCIVLIQNGVGVEEAHRARFPRNPIVSAVTVISAEQIRPGVIRQNRWTRISLGGYSTPDKSKSSSDDGSSSLASRSDACARHLAQIMKHHGGIRDAEAHSETDLQLIRWHKLCINGAMNPSSVLCGGRGNADMVRDPELRAHLRACMEEIFHAVPKIFPGRSLDTVGASPDRILTSTERNVGAKPSMLLDWEAGRPLELEVILGNPIRIARRHGVEMPRLQTLFAIKRRQNYV
ncbi:hypothetical protein VTN49DRAFT_1584 [Thermomyces lanuginosus]|uniref:uncharacterized protein n=1 Tax=Thermomyces lanuginosus TaxID=5541 RepID=UPI0037420ECD